jgi:RNA polymerase sigma-70 factor (ECF subfamily)
MVRHAEFFLGYTAAMSEPMPPISPKYVHEGTDPPRLLVQRTAAGDKEAFHALYRQYGPRVTAIIRRRVVEPEIAEELVQDVFVAAWQSALGYRSDLGDPELWLLGITRHKLQDHWRRVGRIAETVGIPWEGAPREAPLPHPEVRLSIAQALGRLSIDQRRVIDLIYATGLTFREASRVLGVPVGTVKSRVNAALGRMKAYLSDLTRP